MKVIKNINNNVSICIDDDGIELVAFGKGLGFKSPPYEITDLNLITRTFYEVDHRYFDLLSQIPDEIFEISAKVVDFARSKIKTTLNPNIVFTFADHIQFTIKRYNENMDLKFTMFHDLKYCNPTEVHIGEYAIKLINKQLRIYLPEEEVYSIAMHFLNAESVDEGQMQNKRNRKVIEKVTLIIEKHFEIKIDQNGFNYSRFASHMEYLLERGHDGQYVMSQNLTMFDSIRNEFPEIFVCAKKIDTYFESKLGWDLSDEELLYLMLHINRLCAREDCYQ